VKVQLATRLDGGLRQRLRIYAAVTGRTVEDVVGAALDGYLPPAADPGPQLVRGEQTRVNHPRESGKNRGRRVAQPGAPRRRRAAGSLSSYQARTASGEGPG
jgi:hypothetical protein